MRLIMSDLPFHGRVDFLTPHIIEATGANVCRSHHGVQPVHA